MPPALPDEDASGSETEEIPFRDKGKQPATEVEDVDEDAGDNEDEDGGEAGEDGEEDEDGEGGEEYVVEKILSHSYEADGTIFFEVKWLGYEKKADRTWEPEENLDGAGEALKEYFDSKGGRPQPGDGAKPKKGKRKQSVGASPAEAKTGGGRGRKKTKIENGDQKDDTGYKTKDSKKWEPPKGTWEHDIMAIDCIEEEYDEASDENRRVGFVMWNNGKKSKHSLRILNGKCPQKLLHYYEQHLVFRSSSTKASTNAAKQESSTPKMSDNEDS